MLLVATDEAGYGPKLGPLTIVATAWQLPGEEFIPSDRLQDRFAALRKPQSFGNQTIVIDDSKAVYKASTGTDRLAALHTVVSASLDWCDRHEGSLQEWLPHLAPNDLDSIHRAPWLDLTDDTPFLGIADTRDLVGRWREGDVELSDIQARVITAGSFNELCDRGCNKADLLSTSTLGLVRSLVESNRRNHQRIAVFCDRHGGRRYYGSVLQHLFPEAMLQILIESKMQSVYRLSLDAVSIEVNFTVKGDSFTPVALSSMHAKYIRERFMDALNAYFAAHHRQSTPLKPTAGYPVDADRFLNDIRPIIEAENIDPKILVRSR